MLQINQVDLSNHTPIAYDLSNEPAKIHSVRSLREAKKDVWLLLTDYTPTNLNSNNFYIRASKDIIKKTRSCVQQHDDVSSLKFNDLLRIVGVFAKWRTVSTHKTYVIVEPPTLKALAAWERAFAEIGLIVCWIDENGEFHPSHYSLANDTRKIIKSKMIDREEAQKIQDLEPGESVKIIKLTHQTDKYRASIRQWIRRLCREVESEHCDRRFIAMLPAKHASAKYVVVRRMTIDEYEEWADNMPYDMAILKYSGGKTTTQDLRDTINA